jgi:hypothetical protein
MRRVTISGLANKIGTVPLLPSPKAGWTKIQLFSESQILPYPSRSHRISLRPDIYIQKGTC